MKRYFISLSLAASLFFVGCGGGDGDGGVNLDADVVFKTVAKYDLRKYVIPAENSISTYKEKIYTNENGKKSFKDDPEEDIYTEKYDVNSTGVTVKDGSDTVDSVYIVKDDRIIDKETEDNSTINEIVRFADIGDYVLSFSDSKTENGNIPVTTKISCKLTGHYASKKVGSITYDDVLKIECKESSSGNLKNQNIEFSYTSEGETEIYFAKGIGDIYSEDITCQNTNTVLNGAETKNSTCEKELVEIVSHNTI